MKEDDFIGRLVDETYTYLGSEDIPADFSRFEQGQNIQRYPSHDNHLFRFLNTQKCEFSHIQYYAKTGCFRLRVGAQTLDVPSNWSFFAKLYKFCVSEDSVFYEIESSEFDSVMAPVFGQKLQSAFFVVSGRAYFIATAQNYSFVKAWLHKYLEGEISSETSESKAA